MQAAKDVLRPYRAGLYDVSVDSAAAVSGIFTAESVARMAFPFGEFAAQELWETVFDPLVMAWPDLERREAILIAGHDEHGALWVGSGGTYVGTFVAPWLDIPPTGRVTHMRFHEFFRVEGGQIAEMQALWDIPEVMMQAGAWPLAPSLGREWHVPAPATSDGLGPHDAEKTAASRAHVVDMLHHMKRHPSQGGPEVMEMPRFWHEKMSWYGPSGIGTGRGIGGFRKVHQIPFLAAMPDRGQYLDEITYHFMAEGDYVGVTGWPNMIQTLSHGGWMGIAPAGKRITMKSLDFWRLENGLIRENWVLVDLLDVYDQLGVDVFARMREMTGQP